MEKVKKKINNILDNKVVLIAILVTLILFGSFIKVEYSRCTYKMYYNPWEVEYEHFKTLGRYFLAMGWKTVSILGFSLYDTYRLSFAMAMFFTIASIVMMQKVANKFVDNKIISTIISILIVVNPFIIDLYIYIEKGFLIFSIFTTIFAVERVVEYFENKKIRNLLFATILLMCSAFTYQGITTLFVAILLVAILKYSKSILEFIKNNFIVAIIFGIAMGVNLICIKLFNTSTRISGEKSLLANIEVIINTINNMTILSFKTLPKYVFVIVFDILLGSYIIGMLLNKNKVKENLIILLGFLYVIIGTFVMALLPQLSLETASVVLVPRSTFTFGAILGIVMMFAFNKIEMKKFLKVIIVFVFCIYFLLEVFWMQKIVSDHYIVNYLDNATGRMIGECIEKYEEESGVEIKYAIYYEDACVNSSYPEIITFDQMNKKVVSMYSKLLLLNYISGNNLVERHEKNMEYEERFKQQDWDYFNENQLIFDGDTVHICQF